MGGSVVQQAITPFAVFFLRPYKRMLVSTLALMALSAILEAVLIGLLMPMFATLLDVDSAVGGRAFYFLNSLISQMPFESPLTNVLVCFALVAMVAQLTEFGIVALSAHLRAIGKRDASNEVYKHLLHADFRRVIAKPQGEWIHTILTSPHQMTSLFTLCPLMVVQLFRTVAVLVLLLMLSVIVTLGGVLLAVAFYGVTTYVGRRHLLPLGADQVRSSEAQVAIATNAIDGLREIKTYNVGEHWMAKFRFTSDAFSAQASKQATIRFLPPNLLGFVFVALVTIGVAVLQASLGGQYVSFVPGMAVFIAGFGRVSSELAAFGKYRMEIVSMLPFSATVKTELEIKNPGRKDATRLNAAPRVIEFKNVSYSHPGRPTTIDDVSLKMERGQFIAIVGSSGSGKSTLIDLMLGMFEPAEGQILLDGQDLREIDPDKWHSHVGYVGQEGFLFHSSITENILIGRSAADEVVETAAATALIGSLVRGFGQGYATQIGDSGEKLSAGERQRLALARAILEKPKVLILDEATGSLEPETEETILKSLRESMAGGLIVMVSHRLAAVRSADRIIVLDHGSVAETGTHHSLMNKRSAYHRLYAAQGLT